MEEAKRKEIEAKLCRLFEQTAPSSSEESPAKQTTCGARVIRRRKGKPDMQIA